MQILEEIEKEIDDDKYENIRRILLGMFRDLELKKLDDYEAYNIRNLNDAVMLHLNPLNLSSDMLASGKFSIFPGPV